MPFLLTRNPARSGRLLLAALGVCLIFLLSIRQYGWADRVAAPPDRYIVLIVADGFRPDYMQLANMPNLRALMQSGMTYSRAWVGQLQSETPTGHATIVTGVYPRKHDVIGFGWRDPTGQGFTWMPTDMRQLDAGAMEKLIEAGGAPTISDLMHRAYPGSISVSMSGEKYYAADAMGTGADYILYGKTVFVDKRGDSNIVVTPVGPHVPPPASHYRSARMNQDAYPWVQDQFAANLALQMVKTVHPRTLLVNLPGTDIEGHITGGVINPTAMTQVVAGVDKAIGKIVASYKRAGLYKRTLFVFTADHGMLPDTHLIPRKAMYAGMRATGAPYIENDLLTTGGFVYLRDPNQAPGVAKKLAQDHFRYVDGALYKTHTAAGYGCEATPETTQALGPRLTRAYVDLCSTMASPAGPDVVLPYAEDTMGLTVPHQIQYGTHGGFSWRTQHIPLIVSGPGVRHGVSPFAAELVDIAPTIERDIGLPIPAAVDGTVLADGLARPWKRDAAAQRTVAGQRSQDVTALLLHSLAQHGKYLIGRHVQS